MTILWLGNPQACDAALVGGKAANLSRLARMDQHVSAGFCLPVTMMDEAHPFDLQDEISRAISDLMACHSLPDLIAAVRSSAGMKMERRHHSPVSTKHISTLSARMPLFKP